MLRHTLWNGLNGPPCDWSDRDGFSLSAAFCSQTMRSMPWTSSYPLSTYIHTLSCFEKQMHVQWEWLLSSYFGPRAMANFSVYVPSGLCVQANEGVDKACVGCGGSLRTCGITFEMTFILKTRWLRAVKYLAACITGAVTTALCVHTWQQQRRGYNRTPCT